MTNLSLLCMIEVFDLFRSCLFQDDISYHKLVIKLDKSGGKKRKIKDVVNNLYVSASHNSC